MIVNPASGQLNENKNFPCPCSRVKAGFSKRVRPFWTASAHSFSTLQLNYSCLLSRFSAFRDGVHVYHQPPSGQSRVCRVTQLLTGGVLCPESIGIGPVVLKVVPVTGAACFQVLPWTSLHTPLIFQTRCRYEVGIWDIRR